MFTITKINKLLTKVFQQECYLEDEPKKSFYQLKFPGISSVIEFEVFKDKCKKFLSQYDIETGATAILYPNGGSKIFALQMNKLSIDKLLEKFIALMKDSQLHEAVNLNEVLIKELLDNGANINSKNINGETLTVAARRDYEIAGLLLEDFETTKLKFKEQELSDYGDEVKTELTSDPQGVKNIIKFFSPPTQLDKKQVKDNYQMLSI